MDYEQLAQDMIQDWSMETYGDRDENTRPDGSHPDDELLVFRNVVEGVIVDGIKKAVFLCGGELQRTTQNYCKEAMLDFLKWMTEQRDPKILGFKEDSYSPHDEYYLGELSDLVEEYWHEKLPKSS